MAPRGGKAGAKRKSDAEDTPVDCADDDDAGKHSDLVAGEAYLMQWLLEFRANGRPKAEALRELLKDRAPKQLLRAVEHVLMQLRDAQRIADDGKNPVRGRPSRLLFLHCAHGRRARARIVPLFEGAALRDVQSVSAGHWADAVATVPLGADEEDQETLYITEEEVKQVGIVWNARWNVDDMARLVCCMLDERVTGHIDFGIDPNADASLTDGERRLTMRMLFLSRHDRPQRLDLNEHSAAAVRAGKCQLPWDIFVEAVTQTFNDKTIVCENAFASDEPLATWARDHRKDVSSFPLRPCWEQVCFQPCPPPLVHVPVNCVRVLRACAAAPCALPIVHLPLVCPCACLAAFTTRVHLPAVCPCACLPAFAHRVICQPLTPCSRWLGSRHPQDYSYANRHRAQPVLVRPPTI